MKQYCVQIIEVYRQDILIDAEDAEQARDFVADCQGNEGELHFSHTLEPDEWKVFEIL